MITKPTVDRTQKGIVPAVCNYSVWQPCNTGFHPTQTRSRWVPWWILALQSDLPSKIYHISDMSRILAEGLNHYVVVDGQNGRKLKDSITRHQSAQWKKMEECFRDICNISAGYEWAKGYCIAICNTPDTSCITEVKTMKKVGLCYKCRGPHFHHNCKENSRNSSNHFHTETPTWQNYKGNNHTDKFYNNKSNNDCQPHKTTNETTAWTNFATIKVKSMFPMGTLSFQAFQPSQEMIYW